MTLKLPLSKVQRLITLFSNEGEVEKLFSLHNSILYICTIKSSIIPEDGIDDLFYIYLLDLLKLDVVGTKINIHANREISFATIVWHENQSFDLNYNLNRTLRAAVHKSHIKYKCLSTLLPMSTPNTLLIKSFILDYIINNAEGSASSYEQWIIHYLSLLEFLCFIKSGRFSIAKENQIRRYILGIKTIETQVLEDIHNLLEKYTLDYVTVTP